MFEIDVILTSVIAGGIGGFVSYQASRRLNKKVHQMNLRHEKYDVFVKTGIKLKDYLDIVYDDTNMIYINYYENNIVIPHYHLDLFNEIISLASEYRYLVDTFGNLFDITEFDYNKVSIQQSNIIGLYMKLDKVIKNPELKFEMKFEIQELNEKIKNNRNIIRKKLITDYQKAKDKIGHDLK